MACHGSVLFSVRLQLLAEEGEMSSLLEGSVAPELPEF